MSALVSGSSLTCLDPACAFDGPWRFWYTAPWTWAALHPESPVVSALFPPPLL